MSGSNFDSQSEDQDEKLEPPVQSEKEEIIVVPVVPVVAIAEDDEPGEEKQLT
jgi:hypothetical protein